MRTLRSAGRGNVGACANERMVGPSFRDFVARTIRATLDQISGLAAIDVA